MWSFGGTNCSRSDRRSEPENLPKAKRGFASAVCSACWMAFRTAIISIPHPYTSGLTYRGRIVWPPCLAPAVPDRLAPLVAHEESGTEGFLQRAAPGPPKCSYLSFCLQLSFSAVRNAIQLFNTYPLRQPVQSGDNLQPLSKKLLKGYHLMV